MIEQNVSRMPIHVGALVQMRKPHACGGDRWMIYRAGADIGIRCQTCGRQVLLSRSDFHKRVKAWVAVDAAHLDSAHQSKGRG
jgi:hypothetical protein